MYSGLQRESQIKLNTKYLSAEISVERGMPVLTIPLPSRREKCQFTLRPIGATVGDLLDDISKEDGGIDRAAVFTTS